MRRQPGRPYQPRGGGGGDLVGTGFATVLTAVSFLTLNTIGGGGGEGGTPPVEGAEQLQLVPACAILAAGLLFIMYGMRGRGAACAAAAGRSCSSAAPWTWRRRSSGTPAASSGRCRRR